MKDFLENYGFAILASIIVILLIAISTPIGNLIKTHVSSIVESFAYRTENKMYSAFIEQNNSEEVEQMAMPAKGNFVTLDGNSSIYYRVLKTEGNNALLLRMNQLTTSVFNNEYTTTTFGDGNEYPQYADSLLDNAMTAYYNGLSTNIKAAIVSQIIKQSAVLKPYIDETIPNIPNGDYMIKGTHQVNINEKDEEDLVEIDYYFTKASEVTIGERYVYALDVEDIKDYLGKDSLSMANVNTMFYNSTDKIDASSWLRSANQAVSFPICFEISGDGSLAAVNGMNCINNVRPAFAIDLSKVEFIEINPSTVSTSTLGWNIYEDEEPGTIPWQNDVPWGWGG